MGKLDPAEPIDVGTVFQSKLSRGLGHWDGVKLLGDVSEIEGIIRSRN